MKRRAREVRSGRLWPRRGKGTSPRIASKPLTLPGRLRRGFPSQCSGGYRPGPRRPSNGARSRCLPAALRFGFRFQEGKGFLAVDGLDPSALHIVISAVKHLSRLRKLIEIHGQRILQKFVGSATGLRGEIVELLFNFRREVYFHTLQGTG
jgi:hypothetical protein